MKICLRLLVCIALLSALAHARDLRPYFKTTEGRFVLYDLRQNRYLRHNAARCRQRFS